MYIVLYCIVLYCIVLYCIVLYCIVLYCIVLYCIVLYCIVFSMYWRDPRLALVATWVIQSLQNKYVYIYIVGRDRN